MKYRHNSVLKGIGAMQHDRQIELQLADLLVILKQDYLIVNL